MNATPRNRLIVPIVMTIEGSSRCATSAPLLTPQAIPTPTPIATISAYRCADVRRHPHEGRRESHDRRDREVEFAGDDEKRHRQRNEAFSVKVKVRSDRAQGSRKYGEAKLLRRRSATAIAASSISQRMSVRQAVSCKRSGIGPRSTRLSLMSARLASRIALPFPPSLRALSELRAMIAAPEIAICQNGDTWITGRALAMTRGTARPAPRQRPSRRRQRSKCRRSTQAAMTFSS